MTSSKRGNEFKDTLHIYKRLLYQSNMFEVIESHLQGMFHHISKGNGSIWLILFHLFHSVKTAGQCWSCHRMLSLAGMQEGASGRRGPEKHPCLVGAQLPDLPLELAKGVGCTALLNIWGIFMGEGGKDTKIAVIFCTLSGISHPGLERQDINAFNK